MRASRTAFTLVEFLVAIAIIAILVALIMPAVQAARESGRRMECKNNLKNIALAALLFEGAHKRLPECSLNDLPSSPRYHRDVGWLVETLPYMEQQPLFNAFHRGGTTFDITNRRAVSAPISILTCPSSEGTQQLRNLPQRFNASGDSRIIANSADYQGNGGYWDLEIFASQRIGALHVRIESQSTNPVRLASVADGLSNTFLCWESAGAQRYTNSFAGFHRQSWDDYFSARIYLCPGIDTRNCFPITNASTGKAYTRSWPGFLVAGVFTFDGLGRAGSYRRFPDLYNKIVNIDNMSGQPFSFHPGVAVTARLDGSVSTVDASIDPAVFLSLCSRKGADQHFP